MSSSKGQAVFLEVLSDFINFRSSGPFEDNIDWTEVYDISQIHQLTGIVYWQCKDYLKERDDLEDIYQKFRQNYCQTVYQSKQFENAYSKIKKSFSENALKFFPVKGMALSHLYTVPYLRTMGDIDIVLSTEDRNKADQILQAIGYINTVHEDAEWEYKKNDVEIELHNQLEYALLAKHKEFFNDCWKYVTVKDGEYVLDSSFHFLYLILHLRKHLMSFGSGFRQFMDLSVMITQQKETLDWCWIEEKLQLYDLLGFTKICLGFCHCWFKIDPPIAYTNPEISFYETATQTIFLNGVFGFQNTENNDIKVNQLAKDNVLTNGSTVHTVLTRICSSFFPSYRVMCVADHYSFLRGKPYLLPFAWIYRAYRGLHYRKLRALNQKDNIQAVFNSAEEIEKRTQWLKKWNI